MKSPGHVLRFFAFINFPVDTHMVLRIDQRVISKSRNFISCLCSACNRFLLEVPLKHFLLNLPFSGQNRNTEENKLKNVC